MVRVGIAGGSGYGGVELIHLLLRHPETQIEWISSEQHAGQDPSDVYPHMRGFLKLLFSPLADLDADSLDVLFLALPHGKAIGIVPDLPKELLVIDLSGDFRLHDANEFESYYGFPMKAQADQKSFVYGLSEVNQKALKTARRIANPGCFATATLLGLFPLYQAGWIDGPVYVDAKTGSSGSGRNPSSKTHHPKRSQSLFAYKSFEHQHYPEMRQLLSNPANPLIFQPHSAPMVRGIFSSHYMKLSRAVDLQEVEALYRYYYRDAPFVRWVPGSPDVSAVLHSNCVDIGAACRDPYLIVWSTLDNLQKGAAGQAVQNMNLACGFAETTGLDTPPAFP